MSNLLHNLNRQQTEAVSYNEGPLVIIAGAGSGKTRIITHKIAYLINEKKIAPWRILAVTFTNKAAKEMRERIVHLIGENGAKANIFTYHAFCARILREEITNFGYPQNFNIVDEIDQKQILSSIYKEIGLKLKEHPYKKFLQAISRFKNDGISPSSALQDAQTSEDIEVAKVYKSYVEKMFVAKSLDFDDLLIMVHQIFKTNSEVRAKWAKKFDFVLIDEFQDTSLIQYEIIKSVLGNDKLTIVGDPDQTIYTWRKADPSLMVNFHKHFPNAKIVTLELNYRSSSKILEKANNLIKQNTRRANKILKATGEEGEDVVFVVENSKEHSAIWIANKIQELVAQEVSLNDIAIFYRSNYLTREIEQALIQFNINYIIYGGLRFYQRKEIKDAIAFLKILNNGDFISFQRVLNVPTRKIGDVAQEQIETAFFAFMKENKEKNFFDFVAEKIELIDLGQVQKQSLLAFVELINKTRQGLGNLNFYLSLDEFLTEVGYRASFDAGDYSRLENLQELIQMMQEWCIENPENTINDYLEKVSLYLERDDESSSNRVALMTVHASKGLEFDNVFIYEFSEGVFPSSRAIGEGGNEALEEERRLAYVAITRAKKRLFITSSDGMSIDSKSRLYPSRFIKEMGLKQSRDLISSVEKSFSTASSNDNIYVQNRVLLEGDEINHQVFGLGVVVAIEGDLARIAFKGPHGVKLLKKDHKSFEKVGG